MEVWTYCRGNILAEFNISKLYSPISYLWVLPILEEKDIFAILSEKDRIFDLFDDLR